MSASRESRDSKSNSENKTRGSLSRSGGESLSPFEVFGYTCHPLGQRVSGVPYPTARTLPLSGCRPRNSAICLCLSGRPWAPAQSRRWAEGALAPLSRSPSNPRVAQEPPASVISSPGLVSRTRGDRPIPAPRAYLPVPTDGLAADALRPSFSPFPPSVSLLPPPAGWAPPPPLPDRCQSALQLPSGVARGVLGGSEAGRGGWKRRWGAGGARREEGMSEQRSGPKPCGKMGLRVGAKGRAAHATSAEAPAALLESLDLDILGCPASRAGALPRGPQSLQPDAHL